LEGCKEGWVWGWEGWMKEVVEIWEAIEKAQVLSKINRKDLYATSQYFTLWAETNNQHGLLLNDGNESY